MLLPYPPVQAASCSDGVKNNGESDIDCGGASCAKCGTGKSCTVASDCQSGVCTGSVCQVTGTVYMRWHVASCATVVQGGWPPKAAACCVGVPLWHEQVQCCVWWCTASNLSCNQQWLVQLG